MATALVTGGCGFIGSAIVDCLLLQGHQVHIIDNMSLGKDHWVEAARKPTIHVVDILDLKGVKAVFGDTRPEVLFHMAAHHYIPVCEKDPYEAYLLNVQGTLNVLEMNRQFHVKKFFFASTGDVYPPAFAPHREIDMVAPIYVYGHTKYLAEQACRKYLETVLRNCDAIIGRIFNAAGPRETNPHLIPEIVKQIAGGKTTIEVGNLWPKRDFVDVDSMAEIIVKVTLSNSGVEVVNVGSGVVQEIGGVLNLLRAAAPSPIEIVSVLERQRPNDRPYLCPDVSRLARLAGATAKPFGADTARRIFLEALK